MPTKKTTGGKAADPSHEGEKRKPGRPRADEGTTVVWTRLRNSNLAALDELLPKIRPATTRASLIDLAVEEYVQRWNEKNG